MRWIDAQAARMLKYVIDWAGINSGTFNLPGLHKLLARLTSDFAILGGTLQVVDLPPHETIDSRGEAVSQPLGRAISIRQRPAAPVQVFLGIHMDTVYAVDDPFQAVVQVDERTLRGPGVVDAKGGLAVMLVALEALERSDLASEIGWEVLINPDEEIGSPGSADLFREAAGRNHLGLVFEPAYPDGAMVSERKGSGNFSLVVRGRAAHVGRDFTAGRNAILAAADFSLALSKLTGTRPGLTVNVSKIDGGGPFNVVPDLAVVRINARVAQRDDSEWISSEMNRLAQSIAIRHGVSATLHGGILSPPKILDERTQDLCRAIERCGKEMGLPIQWRSSGGVSDGNKLAAAGLPVIDTLGPRGGNLHSPEEFLASDSLTERASLCALLLMKLASGEFKMNTARK